jgi:hypothetical protein
VSEPTTLHWHAEANFVVHVCYHCEYKLKSTITQGKYQTWAKTNSFESMLPGDIKDHKEKVVHAQQAINSHLTKRKLVEWVVPYSDKLFKTAAIEWLIAMDQVCLYCLMVVLLLIFGVFSRYKPLNI